MASPEEEHYRVMFSDRLKYAVQQPTSVLRPLFMQEMIEGEQAYFDGFGAKSKPRKKQYKNEDTQYTTTARDRRAIVLEEYYDAELFDKGDDKRLMQYLRPDGQYVQNCIAAFDRNDDEVIVTALAGSAWGGKNGTTEIPLPSGQKVPHGSVAGLTIEKLRAARKILKASNAIKKGDMPYCIIHPNATDDLLAETEIQTIDSNTIRALVDGEVDTFMGFRFVETTECPTGFAYCCTADSLIFGYNPSSVEVSLDRLPQKTNSRQLLIERTCAATRYFEEKVVEIDLVV